MSVKYPLVSVTIPVYNGENTIQLAINSLIHQTYGNWKCIIVNDCSTDRTAEILKNYEPDSRFKIINLKANMGRGNARQVALDNAEGDYIAFLDADDFYHPNKLKSQIDVFKKYPEISLCSTGVASIDKSYNIRTYRGFSKVEKVHYNFNSRIYPSPPASCMIRLDLAKNNMYNTQLDVGEDNDFIFKCLAGKHYYIINQILYYYLELGVVSYKKYILYQVKYLKSVIDTSSGLILVTRVSIEVSKLVIKIIGALILGPDFFIMKRGTLFKQTDDKEIESVLRTLNSNNK